MGEFVPQVRVDPYTPQINLEKYSFVSSCSEQHAVNSGNVKLRLPREHVDFFKARVTALRPGAEVYLFGSRADTTRKGGDVDILVLCQPKLS